MLGFLQYIFPKHFLALLHMAAFMLISHIANGQASGYINSTDSLTPNVVVPVMKRVEDFALKDNIISKLVRSIFVFSSGNAPPDTIKVSEKPFQQQEGKYIRNINIYVLDAFGYNVNSLSCNREINWLEKLGNATHYPTRNWIIRNKLQFKENEEVDAFKISESERLLRQSAYLTDAKINLIPVKDGSDTVDAQVIVQDVWSIGVGVSGDPRVPNGDISVNDNNFLGLGQRFDSKIWYDEKYYNKIKYSGNFYVPEIGKSFVSGRAFYYTEDRNRNYGVSFNRPFFSPVTPWAGGITAEFKKNYFDFTGGDSVHYVGYHNINQQDVWVGYALKPGPPNSLYQRKTQIVLSGRVSNLEYVNKSLFPQEVQNAFTNEISYLGSIGFSFREYYKDKFIFGFGRTEDIPLGYLLSFTTGIHQTENGARWYNGFKISGAATHSAFGYFFGSIETGGFLKDNNIEQGVINTQFLYFTNMIPIRKYFVRQFLWNRFTFGYNRRPGELLNIDRGEGLRVFTSDQIRGTQKLVTNYEIDIFTPIQPLGFRFVPVIFADFALIGTQKNPLTNSRLFQGYGMGLRLKNERLIFNTFQVSLHYYPGASVYGAQELRHYHTEHPYYRFQGFEASAPYILGF